MGILQVLECHTGREVAQGMDCGHCRCGGTAWLSADWGVGLLDFLWALSPVRTGPVLTALDPQCPEPAVTP